MNTTPRAAASAKHRAKKIEGGYKQKGFLLPPDALAALAELAPKHGGSETKALEAALAVYLHALAKRKVLDILAEARVPPSPVPVADKAKPSRPKKVQQPPNAPEGSGMQPLPPVGLYVERNAAVYQAEAIRRLAPGKACPKPGKK